jgi:ribosomal protein S18 acetylase RimI-like enzyme
MTVGLFIRPYQTTDHAAVTSLWQTCELTRPWNDPSKDIARKLGVQPDWFLVGCFNGDLVASAMFGYDGHRGWMNYLAVAPSHQGKGYARQLIAAGEELLMTSGCPKLSLQIRSSNASVVAFYKHLGYVTDDVVSMGKRLISDN